MEETLPIIEVTGDNFQQLLPCITKAVKDASFVAIDCELSGLGDRSKNNNPEIDVRYRNMTETANNYAVIALGLSCFSCNSVSSIYVQNSEGEAAMRSHDYVVQTFNVLTLCSEPFMVEQKSLRFLHNHGFDFNKLFTKGILYYKGCDRKKDETLGVRHLFSKILNFAKPIVVHNGLLDLVFLYQSFYSDLPKKNDTFAADLDDLFPQGVYDTKYLAEFHQSMPATFLEYLFKKMQLKNTQRQNQGEWHVRIRFPPYPRSTPHIDWHPYLQIHSFRVEDDERELCQMYALYGFCNKEHTCMKSHNVNKVVKVLQKPGAKKRGKSKYSGPQGASLVRIIENMGKAENNNCKKRRSAATDEEPKKKKPSPVEADKPRESDSGSGSESRASGQGLKAATPQANTCGARSASGHRAGYDAFMTAYVFACHIAKNSKLTSKDDSFTPVNIGLSNQVNKVYLMGKTIPFLIRTGTYANRSSNHITKILKVRQSEESG